MNLFTKNTALAIILASLSTGLCGFAPPEKSTTQTNNETMVPKNEPKIAIQAKLPKFKWHTVYADAVKEAKERKLPILIDFTGSDWCFWCHKLDKEVFKKSKWKKWAVKHLVLMKADFPRKKKLPLAKQEANLELQSKYRVDGFPTVIITDADGKKLGELGYQKGGPTKYIKAVKEILNPKPIPTTSSANGWYTSLEEAKRLATSKKKKILLTMTSKGFEKEEDQFCTDLMANKNFIKAINRKFILLHVEFANNGKQSAELKAQNLGLARMLQVNKMPAVFTLNSKGEKVKQFKSYATDATGFVKDFKRILAGGKVITPVIKSTGIKKGKDAHGWYINYEEAIKVAKHKKVPLLIDFSGSDWCHWCMKLDKEVFNTPVFQKYAKDGHIVMLMIDSPRQTKLPASLRKQNELIKSIFEINSFPSVILLNGRGKLLGKAGYQPGGPTQYIEMIKAMLKK